MTKQIRETQTGSSTAAVMDDPIETKIKSGPQGKRSRSASLGSSPKRFVAPHMDESLANRQAELFYLQKQIQLQTQMIFVLEDGARIEGIVEWYDRNSIKVRGKSRVLVYKSAIKYLYKAGEIGTAPGE